MLEGAGGGVAEEGGGVVEGGGVGDDMGGSGRGGDGWTGGEGGGCFEAWLQSSSFIVLGRVIKP